MMESQEAEAFLSGGCRIPSENLILSHAANCEDNKPMKDPVSAGKEQHERLGMFGPSDST